MTGEMYSFRYADDNLFCFQHHYEAVKFQEMLKERLQKFGLKLNEAKTKLCRFGKFAKENSEKYHEKRATFNFLGFTFYNGYSRAGKYRVGCHTQSVRLSMTMNRITSWCKKHRHQDVSLMKTPKHRDAFCKEAFLATASENSTKLFSFFCDCSVKKTGVFLTISFCHL